MGGGASHSLQFYYTSMVHTALRLLHSVEPMQQKGEEGEKDGGKRERFVIIDGGAFKGGGVVLLLLF